jgi:hypothetical protein
MSTETQKTEAGLVAIPIIIVFSPAILLLVLGVLALLALTSICLHILIWTFWCVRGRDILFVYSDSPILARLHRATIAPTHPAPRNCPQLVTAKALEDFAGSRGISPLRRIS